LVAAAVLAVAGSTAAAAGAKTMYVSRPHGSNANPCTASAPCQTIQHTVSIAHAGDTIIVERGTYGQFVSIKKRLRIIGVGGPVDDVHGRDNAFNITGRKAAGTVVSGFTIEHATFEGILVQRTSHVTISGNLVRDNDLGVHAKKPTGECAAFGEVPGDCGEAIHLNGVTDSTVAGNRVNANTGGILLTDELGPTARNRIMGNRLLNNVLDCGITLAGHSPRAVKNGKPQPKVAGVYGNTISGNIANGNGTRGEGAGILLAAGGPGSGVYNNVIRNNTANNNGLAGVTLHSHTPGQDLNGNRITGNKLTHDGVADTSEAEFGGADFAHGHTVGILVGSGATRLRGIVVTGNTISNCHFGIYTRNDASKVNPRRNAFHNVAVKVKQV
jgi:hypothetical protein